jgi:hypothetical protein
MTQSYDTGSLQNPYNPMTQVLNKATQSSYDTSSQQNLSTKPQNHPMTQVLNKATESSYDTGSLQNPYNKASLQRPTQQSLSTKPLYNDPHNKPTQSIL